MHCKRSWRKTFTTKLHDGRNIELYKFFMSSSFVTVNHSQKMVLYVWECAWSFGPHASLLYELWFLNSRISLLTTCVCFQRKEEGDEREGDERGKGEEGDEGEETSVCPWRSPEEEEALCCPQGSPGQGSADWEEGLWLRELYLWTLKHLSGALMARLLFVFFLQNRRITRNLIYSRAQFYHKEYRQMYRREVRMSRMARKAGNFYVPAEPKLAFVIRIRGWGLPLQGGYAFSYEEHFAQTVTALTPTVRWSFGWSVPCCNVVVNDAALFSPSYRPWWFLC